MSSSPHFGTGQTHLNSDAKIADEGRPQGAPLPIAFSRRYALGRAPTRGPPTNCLLQAFCPGEGTHKGRPYQLPSLGVLPWGGHPQGAPLPAVFSRRFALGRAPTRGAPTNCLLQAFCPGEGTHKGPPYQWPSPGVMPWGGRPQGAPLPIAFSRRYALGRAPTRGAPTYCLLSALCPGEGTHKGRPYRFAMPWGGHPQGAPLPIRYALGRAPTRGAPTDSPCPGEGAHKGRPYRFVMPWGGHPQGAPLPIRYALGRAPTRGAPTRFAMPWGGRPQGAPLPIRYALGRAPTRGAPTRFAMPWGGRPQGAPLPIRYALGRAPTRGAPTDSPALGRAPTRGAPTRFRQPHVGLSQFDAIALHFGMHPAAMGRAGAQFGSRRSCCKGNRRRSKDGTDLSVFVPERKAKAHGGHEG